MNALDRAIRWVAPGWAARRLWARARLEAAKGYYDGATVGRRGASIRRSAADANAITARTLPRLRQGSRDLIRNNPHARRAVEAIVSNTVGTGIHPQFRREGKRHGSLELLAKSHLHTTDCDARGRMTYFGIQSTSLQAVVESGEVLIRRRWRPLSDGIKVPIQFELLEADYLDEGKDMPLAGGGRIVQGVEHDVKGRRVAYWLFPEHPGSAYGSGRSERVPARDIAHIYRADRPGQVRGVPWGAAVMLRVADYADYEDAQLVRQKVAACFAAFVEESFDAGPPAGVTKDAEGRLIDRLEPGMIERLPPGTAIKFGTPPNVEGYGEYADVSLHAIASGWGISYEAMTGDLRGVNFSSGKMGRLEFERNIDRWQKLMFYPQLCDRLMRWFLEACDLIGEDVEGVDVRHIAPAKAMIDPPREWRAEREAVRSGQKTWTQVIRERGRDPVEHFDEYAEDMRMLDDRGIIVDSDARARTNAGLGIVNHDGSPADEGNDDAVAELRNRIQDLEDAVPMMNGAHR